MADENITLGNRYGISNVLIPNEGPLVVPATLKYSQTGTIKIDGSQMYAQETFSFLQGVWIDNADNAAAFTLTCDVTGQRIIAPARAQGFYPLLIGNPPVFDAYTTTATDLVINLLFYNMPIMAQSWLTQ